MKIGKKKGEAAASLLRKVQIKNSILNRLLKNSRIWGYESERAKFRGRWTRRKSGRYIIMREKKDQRKVSFLLIGQRPGIFGKEVSPGRRERRSRYLPLWTGERSLKKISFGTRRGESGVAEGDAAL